MKTKILIAAIAALTFTAALVAQDTNTPAQIVHQRQATTASNKAAVLNDLGFTNAPPNNVISIIITPRFTIVSYRQ